MSDHSCTPHPGCPVWAIAEEHGRDYLTPEDIGDAIEKGIPIERVVRALLIAIDIKAIEDASTAAFTVMEVWPDPLSEVGPWIDAGPEDPSGWAKFRYWADPSRLPQPVATVTVDPLGYRVGTTSYNIVWQPADSIEEAVRKADEHLAFFLKKAG